MCRSDMNAYRLSPRDMCLVVMQSKNENTSRQMILWSSITYVRWVRQYVLHSNADLWQHRYELTTENHATIKHVSLRKMERIITVHSPPSIANASQFQMGHHYFWNEVTKSLLWLSACARVPSLLFLKKKLEALKNQCNTPTENN